MNAENYRTCKNCFLSDRSKLDSHHLITCLVDGLDILDHPACPHKFFDNPLQAIPAPRETQTFFPRDILQYRNAWRAIHLYPASLSDDFNRAEVMRWLTYLPVNLPLSCPCRTSFAEMLADMPPDLSTRTGLFRSTVAWHNFKNQELGKPQISDARAARIFGVTHLLPTEEIAADNSGPIRLWINDGWGVGDAVMMTAALRNLLDAYPGEFDIYVSGVGYNWEIFQHLPSVRAGVSHVPKDWDAGGDWKPDLVCHFPLLDHPQKQHMITWMTERLAVAANRPIAQGEVKPWLRLSDTQKQLAPPINKPYIVLAAGHKLNLTCKAYPHWQAAIDAIKEHVAIVRVGVEDKSNPQPKLNAVDVHLVDKTSLEQLIAMIAHPLCVGTLSGDTSLPHIAAAFDKPAVVVAGDRLPPAAVKYHGHTWLRPQMPCAGCNHSRVIPLDPSLPWSEFNAPHHLCKNPDGEFARCMSIIAPKTVARAVLAMIRTNGVHVDTSPNKLAVLVLGAESSGTRILTRLLMAGGLAGSDDLDQPFDWSVADAPDRIVWRRSLPYGGNWPDLEAELLRPCQEAGYSVKVLQIERDRYCVAHSQENRCMVLDQQHAHDNANKADGAIKQFIIANTLPYMVVEYEQMVANPDSLRELLSNWSITLPPDLPPIHDANAKWLP